MKKILLTSVVLATFSLATIMFQISCTKTANGQSNGTTNGTPLNIVVYSQQNTIWTAKTDGNNQHQIPIVMPSGLRIEGDARLTADGQHIIFSVGTASNTYVYLYSCDINGGSVTRIIDNTNPSNGITLGSVN